MTRRWIVCSTSHGNSTHLPEEPTGRYPLASAPVALPGMQKQNGPDPRFRSSRRSIAAPG